MSLKQKIAHRVSTHHASYDGQVYFATDQNPPVAIVKSTMTDPHHLLELYLEIDLRTLKIKAVEVDYSRSPFPQCMQSFARYQEFCGVAIAEGKIQKKLSEFQMRNCLHLNELFLVASRVFIQGNAFFVKNRQFPEHLDEYKMHVGDLPLDERVEINRNWWMKDHRVKDTCHAYRRESEDPLIMERVKDIDPITKMMLKESRNNRR